MADLRTLIMIPLIVLVFEPPDPVQAVSDVILHAEEGSSGLLPCGVYLGNGESPDDSTTLKWTRDGQDFATDLPDEEPRCVVPEFDSRCELFSNGSLQIQNLQDLDDDYSYRCHRGKDSRFQGFSDVGLMVHKQESPKFTSADSVGRLSGQTFKENEYKYNLQVGMKIDYTSSRGNSVGINCTVTSEDGLSSSRIMQVQDVDDCSSSPCLNEATCVDRLLEFTCNCSPGWTGLLCEINADDCSSRPCLNGATCVDRLPGFTCNCTPGYTGYLCGIEVEEARNWVWATVSAVLLAIFLLIAILALLVLFVCNKKTGKPGDVRINGEEGEPLNNLGNNQRGKKQLKKRIETLQQANQDLEQRVTDKDRERKEEHDKELKQIETLQQAKQDLEQRVTDKDGELSQKAEAYKAEKAELEQKLRTRQEEHDKELKQIETLQQVKQDLEQRVYIDKDRELSRKAEASKAEKAELEQKFQTRKGEYEEELKQMKEQYKSREAQTQKEHDEERKKWRTKLKEEKNDLEAELKAEFGKKKKALNERIDELEAAWTSTKDLPTRSLDKMKKRTDNHSSSSVRGNSTEEGNIAVSHPDGDSSRDNSLLPNTSGSTSVDTSLSEVGEDSPDNAVPSLQESQIESNYSLWTCGDVTNWLESINMSEYTKEFLANKICGEHLLMLSEEDLVNLGVAPLGHRITIMTAIGKLW